MRTGIIYKFECLDTKKCYIGQTIRPKQRFKEHIIQGLSGLNNHPFYQDFIKYSNWSYQILEKDIPETELNEAEIYYIALFDSYNNGYNIRKGGGQWGGHVNYTEQHKEALRKSWTDERKKSASETQKIVQKLYWSTTEGKLKAKHHSDVMKGRILSEETRNKISESNKGRIVSEETRNKISNALTGIKHSDISKKHMSDAHKGKSPGNKGKHLVWNEEHTKFHYE